MVRARRGASAETDAGLPETNRSPRFALRARATGLLLLAVALAVAGRQLLAGRASLAWFGAAALLGSFVSLLLSLVLAPKPDGGVKKTAQLQTAHSERPTGTWLLAIGLAASVAATACSQSPREWLRGWVSFALWSFGVVALAAFAVIGAVRSRRAPRDIPVSPLELVGVISITALAFLVRFVRLDDLPYPISGDEASVGLEGFRILEGSSRDMFRTGWSLQPNLSFLGPALSMSQFGRDLTGLRMFPVLLGTLTVPVLYFGVRAMFSGPVAVVAATLLGTMAFHLHFSRIAVNNADAALLVCAVAMLLFQIAASRRPHWYVWTGLATGFALYSFAGARLVFVLALLYLGYLLAADRDFRREWPKLLLFVVAVAVVVLPTAAHFVKHPDVGFGRLQQMGVFQTGWLANEAARSGHPAVVVLGRQLFRSVAILVSAPAISGFYNSPKPLLDPFWSIAFFVGMLFSWIGLSDRRHVLLNIWFWSVFLFGGALVLPPPAAERFLLATPAVATFAALGIRGVWSLLGRIWAVPSIARAGAALTVLALSVSSLVFYFREYTPAYYFADANSEVGTELGRYLARDPRVRYVYFTGLPRMWYRSFASTDFLSGGIPGQDFPDGEVPDIRGKRRPLLFVALPHLKSNLAAIARAYPGGRLRMIFRRSKPGEPLFFFYRLD